MDFSQLALSETQLADYPFAPDADDDSGYATFGQIVTFASGMRSVKVIRTSDGAALATKAISANAPVVSNVALQGAPNPVTVTLGWTASSSQRRQTASATKSIRPAALIAHRPHIVCPSHLHTCQ